MIILINKLCTHILPRSWHYLWLTYTHELFFCKCLSWVRDLTSKATFFMHSPRAHSPRAVFWMALLEDEKPAPKKKIRSEMQFARLRLLKSASAPKAATRARHFRFYIPASHSILALYIGTKSTRSPHWYRRRRARHIERQLFKLLQS